MITKKIFRISCAFLILAFGSYCGRQYYSDSNSVTELRTWFWFIGFFLILFEPAMRHWIDILTKEK